MVLWPTRSLESELTESVQAAETAGAKKSGADADADCHAPSH